MTLISAPLQRFMPVREIVLQPISFGEIERPTTNPFPSLLRSSPEGLSCQQASKYESDVFLSQPVPVPLQNRNVSRFIAEQVQYKAGGECGDEWGSKNQITKEYRGRFCQFAQNAFSQFKICSDAPSTGLIWACLKWWKADWRVL